MRRGKRSTTRVERQREIKKKMRMRRRRKRGRRRRRMKRCRRKRTISKMMDSTCTCLKEAVRIERILTM